MPRSESETSLALPSGWSWFAAHPRHWLRPPSRAKMLGSDKREPRAVTESCRDQSCAARGPGALGLAGHWLTESCDCCQARSIPGRAEFKWFSEGVCAQTSPHRHLPLKAITFSAHSQTDSHKMVPDLSLGVGTLLRILTS